MSTTNLFCVVFRTGGTINYKWHRTIAMAKPEAEEVAEASRRMGYVSHVEHFNLSMSVGLPETYEVGGGPLDPEDWVEADEREAVLRSMGRMEDQP